MLYVFIRLARLQLVLVEREKLSITDTYNVVANASVNEVQLQSYVLIAF